MSVAEIERTAGTKDWLTLSMRVDDVTLARSRPPETIQVPDEIGVGTNTRWKFAMVSKYR